MMRPSPAGRVDGVIGLLYVVLTALLMLGGVFEQEGVVAAAIFAMIAALVVWAVRSRSRT